MLFLFLVFTLLIHSECFEDSSDVETYLPKPVIGAFFNRNGSLRQSFSLAVRTVNRCMFDYKVCELIHPTPPDINKRLFHQVEFYAITVESDEYAMSLHAKFGILAGVNIDDQLDSLDTYGDNNKDPIINDYGLALVVGPHERIPSIYIQSLSEIHDIPQIVIRRELDFQHDPVRSINFYPDTETLAQVYIEMLGKLNWTTFSILYERTENFLALDNVLKMYPTYEFNTYAYKLGRGPDFSEILLKVKATKQTSFLIDCGSDILTSVMKQAQQVGLMTDAHQYVITTLDLHAVNLQPYQHSGVNISGLQLVDVHNPNVREFVGAHLDDFGINRVEDLKVKDAIIFDAITLFAQAYKDLNYENQIFRGAKLFRDYDRPLPWSDGLSLRNYMLATEINGLTGPVMMDGDGVRRRFKLDVVNLHETGLTRVGKWNFEDGFGDLQLLKHENRPHYKVLITLVPPYAIEVNHSSSVEGNARYEGFAIDLIKKLSEEMNFDYTFYEQKDKKNGNCTKHDKTEQCECTGIMGRILNYEMDMAITDLTRTEDREKCVQFSSSFMMLGMAILFKKPQKAEATWYSFFAPFKTDVWIYIALTYTAITIMFFFFGRMSHAEWINPFPCIEEPTELHNQFSISNTFWFTVGAKMQQGSEIAPIGYGPRTLSGWWWFCCLIVINTYIANLAASLTVEIPVVILKDIKGLVNQTEIKFGAKEAGSTLDYFKSSSDPDFQRLYRQMMDEDWKKEYLVKSNEDGIRMAKRKDIKYAFFMESKSIEYTVQRECDLQQTGDLIDQKSYAIAYAKNFSRHREVSNAIIKLQESLVIEDLRAKWWDMKGATCGKDDSSEASAMTLDQMKGIFYVLGVGLLIGICLSVYEFLRHIQSISKKMRLGFWKVAKLEFKLMTKRKRTKPVLINLISSEMDSLDGLSNNLTMSTHA